MCFLRSIYVNESQDAPPEAAEAPGAGEARERQVTAEVVDQLRKELSLTLRRAGMAEVATGTLHNVGNVLNSISVSANLVTGHLRESRVSNLCKALALLREHSQDLAGYLTQDPKGKLLPGYLETLAEHYAGEQAELLREMEDLGRNLEHVKEIVAMQQSYARMCGVMETLQVSELVEDALRMNLGAFERHGITIIRQFERVPPVAVDKHKVLQILINFMRNAKYALDEEMPAAKRLTLRIAADGEGHVVISVSDNGIGIAPENLSRIFGRGFTTKRDGHGFGLHSGVLAAQEMGGSLTAHSDGLHQGATFRLVMPLPKQNSENNYPADGNRSAIAAACSRS